MAYLVSNQDGNYNTSANWDTITNTPTIQASANINLSASNQFTGTFTAPSLSDAVTGVGVYIASKGSAGTITFQLQELGLDVAGVNFTLSVANIPSSGWVFGRLASPYTFMEAGANAYRWKITIAGATGTTSLAAGASASVFSFLSSDDRNQVPTEGNDDIFVAHEITVNTTGLGAGTGQSPAVLPTGREVTNAVNIVYDGTLKASRAADNDFTTEGHTVVYENAAFDYGTTSDRIPEAYTATYSTEMGGSSGQFVFLNLNLPDSQIYAAGQERTRHATYASGDGTTGNELTTQEAHGWSVGDKIIVGAGTDGATNYNETEVKYVRTVPSTTTATLADTPSGAESGLSFSKSVGTIIVSLHSNVEITTTDPAEYFDLRVSTTDESLVVLDSVRVSNIGQSTGITLDGTSATLSNVICDNVRRNGFYFDDIIDRNLTFTNLVVHDADGNATNPAVRIDSSNQLFTINGLYLIDTQRSGLEMEPTTGGINIQNVHANACARSGNGYALELVSAVDARFTDVNIHACRNAALLNSVLETRFTRVLMGTLAENGTTVTLASNSFSNAVFDQVSWDEASDLVTNEENVLGGRVGFQTLNDDASWHREYQKGGYIESTGAGLPDTTTQAAGSLACRFVPNGQGTPMIVDFLYPTSSTTGAVSVNFQARRNSSFTTGTYKFELYLPGLVAGVDTPSDTETFSAAVDTWDAYGLTATYTGTVDAYSTLRFILDTTDSGAIVYFDTFNGALKENDPIQSVDVFNDGRPSTTLSPAILSAQQIWGVLAATLNVDGTIGQVVLRIYRFVRLIFGTKV